MTTYQPIIPVTMAKTSPLDGKKRSRLLLAAQHLNRHFVVHLTQP